MKRIILLLIASLLSTSVAIQPMKQKANDDVSQELAKCQAQGQGSDQAPMDVLQNHFELSFPNELINYIMLLTMDNDPEAPWKCIQKLYRQYKPVCKRFDLSFPLVVQIARWMDIPSLQVYATTGNWHGIVTDKNNHDNQPDRCIRACDKFGFQPIDYANAVKHDDRKDILQLEWDKDNLEAVLSRLCTDEQITPQQAALYLTQNEMEHEVLSNIDNANFQKSLSELLASGGNINCSNPDGMLVTFEIIEQALHEKLYIMLEMAQEKSLNVISIQDQKGWTVLHFAADYGSVDCLKELLKRKGIDVKAQDKDGWRALKLAIEKGKLNCVQEFLKCEDIDVNIQDINGDTALHNTFCFSELGCAQELLKHKNIKCNVPNQWGALALHYAALLGETEFIKRLAGPNLSLVNAQYYPDAIINDKNYGLYTVLHLAAEKGHVETVRELIDCGANIDLKNQEGKTALDLARESGHQEIVELLEELGASIEFSKS